MEIEFSPPSCETQKRNEVDEKQTRIAQGSFDRDRRRRRSRTPEINFSPGGSDLPTAAPPETGSFAIVGTTTTTSTSTMTSAATMIAPLHTPPPPNRPKEINFSPGASDMVTAPPPRRGSYVGEVIERNQTTDEPDDDDDDDNHHHPPALKKEEVSSPSSNHPSQPTPQDIEFEPPSGRDTHDDGDYSVDIIHPAVPLDGSFDKNGSHHSTSSSFDHPKEVNFSPGGSNLRGPSEFQPGSFVRKRTTTTSPDKLLGDTHDDDSNNDSDGDDDEDDPMLEADQAMWKSQKVWEATHQPADDDDDGVVDPSLRAVEAMLESALNAELDSPQRKGIVTPLPPTHNNHNNNNNRASTSDDDDDDGSERDGITTASEDTEPHRNLSARRVAHYDHANDDDDDGRIQLGTNSALDDDELDELLADSPIRPPRPAAVPADDLDILLADSPVRVPRKANLGNRSPEDSNLEAFLDSALNHSTEIVFAPSSTNPQQTKHSIMPRTKLPSDNKPARQSRGNQKPLQSNTKTRSSRGAKNIISRITSWGKPKATPKSATEKTVNPRVMAQPPSPEQRKKPTPKRLFQPRRSKQKRGSSSSGGVFERLSRPKPTRKPTPLSPKEYTFAPRTNSSSRTSPSKIDVFERLTRSKPKPLETIKRKEVTFTPNIPKRNPTFHFSSARSVGSLSSQCSVSTFSSPRRTGIKGCQSKYNPYLYDDKGPCELCVFFLSDEDKAKLDSDGRHFRVMFTTGGCCPSCEVFPRGLGEHPPRLCPTCFNNSHRFIKRKTGPPRYRVLRTRGNLVDEQFV